MVEIRPKQCNSLRFHQKRVKRAKNMNRKAKDRKQRAEYVIYVSSKRLKLFTRDKQRLWGEKNLRERKVRANVKTWLVATTVDCLFHWIKFNNVEKGQSSFENFKSSNLDSVLHLHTRIEYFENSACVRIDR